MRRAAVLIIIVLALSTLGGLCGDSSNNSGSGGATTPSGSCTDNTAPKLTAIGFSVDGAVAEGDASAALDSSILLVLGYEDAECNLGGGTIRVALNGADPAEATIPGGIECKGSALADSQLTYDIQPTATGELTIEASVADLCGAAGSSMTATLTVTEPTGDDTSDDTSSDDTASDDTADDDASPQIEGQMEYYGDKTAAAVVVMVYEHWLPTGLPLFTGSVTVPGGGFPFGYLLELTGVPDGSYYIAAYFDAAAGDGVYNPLVDPTSSPWYTVALTAGQTTAYNITMVDPD